MRWEGVDAFLAVAASGGFGAAARRLGVSTSHVSRQVAALERRLGVKLFARSTRVVKLTDAGASYHAQAARAAELIDEADLAASGAQSALAGVIRVSAAGHFAETAVAASLARFAQAHAGVAIEMVFDARLLNLAEEGVDFAIRYGPAPTGAGVVRKLTTRVMACVAAPSYLDAHGRPDRPQGLDRHACLRSNADIWRFQDPVSGDVIVTRPRGPFRADNGRAIASAAAAGLGVAYLPASNFRDELAGGALETVLAGWEDASPASWILYPERRFLPRRVRLAIDHLIAELGD